MYEEHRLRETPVSILKSFLAICAMVALIGSSLLLSPSYTYAQNPTGEALPDLTPDGTRWGRKLVNNSIKIAAGQTVRTPPFIDAELAGPVALAASVEQKAATLDPHLLLQDPDFIALNDLIREQVEAGGGVTFEAVSALISALNSQQKSFPPVTIAAGSVGITPRTILDLALTLTGFNPHAREAERHTEGQLLEFAQPNPPGQVADMYYINGVQTNLVNGRHDAAHLGMVLGRKVNHIHNAAGPFLGDLFQTLLQAFRSSDDPGINQVKTQVLEHVQSGMPLIFACHSQGAQVCAQGIRKALEENPLLEEDIKKFTRVITLGGFAMPSDFPPGIVVDPIAAQCDPIPSLRAVIALTRPGGVVTGIIRSAARALKLKCHSLTASYVRTDGAGETQKVKEALARAEEPFQAPAVDVFGTWKICFTGSINLGEQRDTICDPCDLANPGCRTSLRTGINSAPWCVGRGPMTVQQAGSVLRYTATTVGAWCPIGASANCSDTLSGSVNGDSVSVVYEQHSDHVVKSHVTDTRFDISVSLTSERGMTGTGSFVSRTFEEVPQTCGTFTRETIESGFVGAVEIDISPTP